MYKSLRIENVSSDDIKTIRQIMLDHSGLYKGTSLMANYTTKPVSTDFVVSVVDRSALMFHLCLRFNAIIDNINRSEYEMGDR